MTFPGATTVTSHGRSPTGRSHLFTPTGICTKFAVTSSAMRFLDPETRELLIKWTFRVGFALVAILSIYLSAIR